jgi:hypothetical protein
MEKVAEYGRKVKAIALLFLYFFVPFLKVEILAKNRRRLKAIALLFSYFYVPFSKM